MATQALLLCRDPDVVGVLRPMLEALDLEPEVCSAADSALGLLHSRQYNPVIVDCEPAEGGELLRRVRQSAANRDSIALGIVADGADASHAFALGANLVIRKPLDSQEAGRILRTARALVNRMRRRFLRHVLHTLAYVHVEELRDTPMLLDIGEGGLALQALDTLEEGRAVSLRFSLPGDPEEYRASATAAWSDSSGRVGLRFLRMSSASRRRLRHWLACHDATGPADIAIGEDADWLEQRVQFPLQLTPVAHALCSGILDVLIVAAAVGAFALVTWLLVGEVPPAVGRDYAALLLGCVCWLLYRYVFFGSVSATPGGHAAAAIAGRISHWMRQRARLP